MEESDEIWNKESIKTLEKRLHTLHKNSIGMINVFHSFKIRLKRKYLMEELHEMEHLRANAPVSPILLVKETNFITITMKCG